MVLRRGFKAEAERIGQEVRSRVGLGASEPFQPVPAATRLGVEVLAGDALIPRTAFEELRAIQSDAFSACTFRPSPTRTVIVFNPLNAEPRRNSDITHELAHVLLDHRLSQLQRVGTLSFFVCDTRQEEEATWLSGCLLLPRPLLLVALSKKKSVSAIAKAYGVSEEMVTYRINVTGVRAQLERAKQR